ncbi:MAG: Crp/Fnr family transcriptional regulator [Microbacter sp.]
MESSTYDLLLMELLGKNAASKMLQEGILKRLSSQSVIVHEGQYFDSIPILLEGYAKMMIQQDGRSFLLQYISPVGCCVMPYSAVNRQLKSCFGVVTESDVVVLYIPSEKILKWLFEFPLLNDWLQMKYNEYEHTLLNVVQQLLFDDLEMRLLHFLKEKARISKSSMLFMKHKEIAAEIGSVREVVTRTLLKLQKEQKIIQHENGVELLSL